MKKHIFAGALIILTVGCQPNSSNTMRSQSETMDVLKKGSTVEGDKSSAGTDSDSSKTTVETSSTAKADIITSISIKAFEAAVRMQMDIAGTKDTSAEMVLLEKLFTSTAGPDNAPVRQALKEGKIPLSIEVKDLESVSDKDAEITALSLAFKQVAADYGFDEAAQNSIQQAIAKRGSLLAPLESQKKMAEANGVLLQQKANALIKAFTVDKENLCSALDAYDKAISNFYDLSAPYTLPSLIQRKGDLLKPSIAEALSKCTSDIEASRKILAEKLPDTIAAMTFDLGSLELYLTPKNTFNWEELENFKAKALLLESPEVRQAQGRPTDGTLSFSDVTCKVDGKDLVLGKTKTSSEGSSTSFDLQVNGERPLVLEKQGSQRGVSLVFNAKNIKVTYFNAMTLTKIKPSTLTPAINLIPGDSANFQFSFLPQADAAASTVICNVKGAP